MSDSDDLTRILGRAIGAAIAGWIVVYSIFRLGGDSPSSAAWVSLGVGAVIGLVIYGIVLFLQRRRQPGVVGPDEDLATASAEQHDLLRIVGGILGGFALIAAVMALASAAEWFSADAGDRPWTPIVLTAWYALAAGWSADQAIRAWQGDAEDLDSLPLVATLTAILAALGFARGVLEPGQIVLIVAAIVAGGASAVLGWRLAGSRGVPLTAVGVVVVSLGATALAFV